MKHPVRLAMTVIGLALQLAAAPSRAQVPSPTPVPVPVPAAAAAPAAAPVQVQAPARADADAALVLRVDGGAQRRQPERASDPGRGVGGYAGLRRGELVDLAGDARLGVAYLASGVVESWRGPARFRVGDIGSNFDQGTPERTLALPRSLLDQLAHAPELLAELERLPALPPPAPAGAPASADLQQARADRAGARVVGAEPWLQALPELGLFLALYEARVYPEADALIAALARRLPEEPMVAALDRAFERLYRKALP